MQFGYKISQPIKLNYVSLNNVTGLTDVIMTPYNPSGISQTPITMTEVSGQGGLYQGTFTPNAVGQWRVKISSSTNGDLLQTILEILNHNIDDVYNKNQTGSYLA